MSDSLTVFILAIVGAVVTIVIMKLSDKSESKKFAKAIAYIAMIMAIVSTFLPMLIEHQIRVSLFSILYLIGLIGWLFLVRNKVLGLSEWDVENDAKKGIRKIFLILIFGFFVITIYLVSATPHFPDWT